MTFSLSNTNKSWNSILKVQKDIKFSKIPNIKRLLKCFIRIYFLDKILLLQIQSLRKYLLISLKNKFEIVTSIIMDNIFTIERDINSHPRIE